MRLLVDYPGWAALESSNGLEREGFAKSWRSRFPLALPTCVLEVAG